MEELSRKIGLALLDFHDTMLSLNNISDLREREGKKAVKVIMSINDIEAIFTEELEKIKI